MDVLLTLSTILTVKSLYDKIKVKEPILEKAYNKALSKWTKNNSIRKKHTQKYVGNLSSLKAFLKDKDSLIGNDIKSLLELWEKELREDAITYNLILEIKSDEILGNSKEILSNTKDIKSEVLEMRDEILKKLDNYNSESITKFDFPVYSFLEINYIPRYVSEDDDVFNSKRLSDFIIEDCKHLMLYSEAQSGKTTELKYLAYELYESELYKPVLYELRNLVGNSLQMQPELRDFFKQIELKTVLILDGLDELKDDVRDNVIREIRSIKARFENLYIVISCRLNYAKTNLIEGF